MKNIILIIGLSVSIIGCASVPMGDPSHDMALKKFQAPQSQAGIYIYRNESFGAAVTMDVEIDGKQIGSTAANTYLYKIVKPGKHTITSKAENDDTIEVNVKAGTLSYIWQEVKMGFLFARTKLNLVNDTTGKKGVLETSLAKTK